MPCFNTPRITMRQFMKNEKPPQATAPAIKQAPKAATECSTCGGGETRTTGQESATPPAAEEGEKKPTIVMSGPFGAAVTEALNKSRAKTTAGMNASATAATESLVENVSANGQFYKPDLVLSRISKSVGMIPKADDAPTPLNMMIDVASKVDTMDFVIVHSIEAPVAQSVMPQKSIIHYPAEESTTPGLEGYAIEGVQMVVTLRKLK